METSRLSSKGQVTVPKAIRDLLELQPGDTVAYEVAGGKVILRRMEPLDAAFHAALSETLVDEWNSPEDDEAFRDL